MPYSIKRAGGKFQVITSTTGKVHGTHKSRTDAERQMRAIYANAPPENEPTSKAWAREYVKRGHR